MERETRNMEKVRQEEGHSLVEPKLAQLPEVTQMLNSQLE
jgi:hypothetical protein